MSSAIQKTKVSDLPPTTLRLAPGLLDLLKREAAINRRSLSAEVEVRLDQSFKASAPPLPGRNAQSYLRAEELPQAQASSTALNESQRLLLSLYAALPPEKQLALLTFLKR